MTWTPWARLKRWWLARDHDADGRVLAAIEAGYTSGLGISRATGLGSGRVLGCLWRLERAGWITSTWERDPGDRPPRRLYALASPPELR